MKAQLSKLQTPVTETPRKPFKKIPGQKDFLADDWRDLEHLKEKIKKLAHGFGFVRVEPALFEFMETVHKFHTGPGEPLAFKSNNGSDVALRTNTLSGLLRMYVEGRVAEKENLSKWFYLSPVTVQQNNPYQLLSSTEYGFEVIGDESPVFDAQILALAWKLYGGLGQDNVFLEIGSRGCENCWPEYQQTLVRNFSDAKYSLCKDCALSVDKNPEKVLACEQAECQSIAADAPAFIDYLDSDCATHLTSVLEALDELGVPYALMTTFGADNHVKRTVFRFRFNHPQDSFILSQGSRHDALFNKFGHAVRPALGLVGQMDSLLRAWHLAGGEIEKTKKADVAVIPLGVLGAKKSLSLFSMFWDEAIAIVNLCDEHNLKARIQYASDMKIPIALIVGQKEALEDTVILRDVRSGMQEVFPSDRILSEVRKRLGD